MAKVAAVGVGLSADLRPADAARVIVLLAARQDERELLPDGRRPFAAGAEEARRLQLAKAVYHGLILDQESVGRAWSASSSQMGGVMACRIPMKRRDGWARWLRHAASSGSTLHPDWVIHYPDPG